MRLRSLAFALTLFWLLPAAAAEEPCVQAVDDPVGDQTVPGNPALDTSPADILRVEMAWTDEGAALATTLAGDPRTVEEATYSYWVSFQDGGRSAGGNPPTWTWQGDDRYERISTMYWDAPDDLPVTWDGTTFRFVVPWSAFEAQYGKAWPIDFGSPRVATAGPNAKAASLNNPTEDHAVYDADLVPLGPCDGDDGAATAPASADPPASEGGPDATPAPSPEPTGGAGSKETPPVPAALLVAAVLVAARRARTAEGTRQGPSKP